MALKDGKGLKIEGRLKIIIENTSDYVNIVLRFKSQKEKRNTGLTKGKLTYPTKVRSEIKSAQRSFASNNKIDHLRRFVAILNILVQNFLSENKKSKS